MKKLWIPILFCLLLSFFTLPFIVNMAKAQTYYTYTIHGPYYDEGAVASSPTVVSCVMLWVNQSALSFTLANVTVGVANTTVIVSTYPASQLIWTYNEVVNYTRIYTFLGTSTETVYVHIPDPLVPSYIYTFNIADFYGMVNPYLETTFNNGTMNQVVERKSLNVTGVVSFVMETYRTYGLNFRCNQGVYAQSFTPETTFTTNLQVLAGAFPTTTQNISSASAERVSSTRIDINYTDPDLATDWLYVSVLHLDGADEIVDYTDNQTSVNTYTTSATVDNATDYYVQIIASRSGTTYEWNIPCPILTPTNPFFGLFDFLGTWPTGMDPAQLLAAAIIMCCLGLGSFRSAGISCVLAWVITGVLMAMGWYTIGIPLFAFAGVFSILVVIDEARSTSRES